MPQARGAGHGSTCARGFSFHFKIHEMEKSKIYVILFSFSA